MGTDGPAPRTGGRGRTTSKGDAMADGDHEFATHLRQLADRIEQGRYEGIEYTAGPEFWAGRAERMTATLRMRWPLTDAEAAEVEGRGVNAAPERLILP